MNLHSNEKIRALVIGHTGATGKALMEALIASNRCESIVAIGRRENETYKNSSKVKQLVLPNMLEIAKLSPEIGKGCNAAFSCIGTPFNDVLKSSKSDSYRSVDFGIVTSFADYARSVGITYIATITGAGTELEKNKNIPMYRVKQDVEHHIGGLGFERVAFMRPGFLDRGADAGWVERLMLPGLFGIPVSTVAKAMIGGFLTQEEKLVGYNNKAIRQIATGV
jgi:oxidoreductase